MTSFVDETQCVDILIQRIDAKMLMKLMDIIHEFHLDCSFSPDDAVGCDNDIEFEYIMREIISQNNVLSISMKPLVDDVINTFQEYANDETHEEYEMYEQLVQKSEEIEYEEIE